MLLGGLGLAAVLLSTWSFLLRDRFVSQQKTCGLMEQDLGKFVEIPSGAYSMRSRPQYPEERGTAQVEVKSFLLQTHEVTNKEFARFVAATGYRTTAEQLGESAVFSKAKASQATAAKDWWKLSKNCAWWTPDGPGSDLQGREHHPVVHVSWHDAQAYAKWAKARLPTEEEWEYAASLGLFESDRTDSGAFGPNGEPRANVWTGEFPMQNDAGDGFVGRAPVGCYQASKVGAYDMIGNVWEWTSTPFATGTYTIKGGSHLCSKTYCHRYRTAARQGLESDFSTSHIGFRIVRDLPLKSAYQHQKENL